MKLLFSAALLILSLEIGASAQTAPTPTISIVMAPAADEMAKHGADKIIAALSNHHVSFEQINSL